MNPRKPRKCLPGRFGYAGNLTGERQLAKRDTRHAKFSDERTRTTAHRAAITDTDLGGILGQLAELLLRGEEFGIDGVWIRENRFQFSALLGVLGNESNTLLVTDNGRGFRHGG